MADQSELTRRRRLAHGACPTHGVGLVLTGRTDPPQPDAPAQYKVKCPRRDCDFTHWVTVGSKMDDALRGSGCCRKKRRSP